MWPTGLAAHARAAHDPGDATMSALTDTLHTVSAVLGGGGLLYTVSVASATVTSLFARTPERRRDARATLQLLLRHRSEPNTQNQLSLPSSDSGQPPQEA